MNKDRQYPVSCYINLDMNRRQPGCWLRKGTPQNVTSFLLAWKGATTNPNSVSKLCPR